MKKTTADSEADTCDREVATIQRHGKTGERDREEQGRKPRPGSHVISEHEQGKGWITIWWC